MRLVGLQVRGLEKSFEKTRVLEDVSFEVSPGEVLAILGESGSGKSTLLSIIAGLIQPDQGEIAWDDESLAEVPPHLRRFGLMFQDYALFPHLSVFENVAFGLRMSGVQGDHLGSRVEQVLKLVRLRGFDQRDISTLSGGEQQRVALARSMAPNPRLLMLDEPLGSLDRRLREQLLSEIRQILLKLGQTAIYVTHDQEEAFTVAQRLLILDRRGSVAQIGTPQQIYHHPSSEYVARFLGLDNIIKATVQVVGGSRFVHTPFGAIPADESWEGEVTVLLRPDAVNLDGQGSAEFRGRLLERSFVGNSSRVIVESGDLRFKFEFPARRVLPPVGEEITITYQPEEAVQLLR
jgi:ABC-type Fe3+/spermidine/putrescine transport system ATPase subunit